MTYALSPGTVAPPPVWQTSALSEIVPGTGYDVQIQDQPGAPSLAVTFETISGLPAGISLSSRGRLSGTILPGHAGPREPKLVVHAIQRAYLRRDHAYRHQPDRQHHGRHRLWHERPRAH